MTAAEGVLYEARAEIGGRTYTVRVPEECRPDALRAVGMEFPDAVPAAMLAALAVDLMRPPVQAPGVVDGAWRAVATLMSGRDRLALAERVALDGDPLTLEGLRRAMLEAVQTLAEVTPRPRVLGGAECTTVDIAGRTYTAAVPERLVGMPAELLEGTHPAYAPEVAEVAALAEFAGGLAPHVADDGAALLALLLFDDATLAELAERVSDPADPCTAEALADGARAALAALAVAPAPFGDGRPLEAQIAAELEAEPYESTASPVVLAVGGARYRCAWPACWPRLVELVAQMHPLTSPCEGVERDVQLRGLAALVAAALPLLLEPARVAELGGHLEAGRVELVQLAEALARAVVDLDAAARRLDDQVWRMRVRLAGGAA